MGIATNGDLTFLGWLFTFSGILTVIIVALIIWAIFTFIQKNKNNSQNKQNQNHFPPKQQYQSEMDDEKSFWDDFNKNEDFPQRVEEPVPPNAIPPSPTPTYSEVGESSTPVNCEVKLRSDGLYEKDCYKEMTTEGTLADVEIQKSNSQNNNE